jgi:SsrA-binding protein
LINSYIPEYKQAGQFNHEARRPRKLLLHKRQIGKMIGSIQREGMTLVPLKLYFNDRGRAKLELGVAKGKRNYDKRESEKKKDWDRQKARAMRDKG